MKNKDEWKGEFPTGSRPFLSPLPIPAGIRDPYNSRKPHFRKKIIQSGLTNPPFPLCRSRRGLAIPITHGNSTSGKKHSIRAHQSPFPALPIPAGLSDPYNSRKLPPQKKTFNRSQKLTEDHTQKNN